MILETPRLLLRTWKPTDFDAFVQMNLTPEVMRFFPSTLTPMQSVESARRLSEELDKQGWGMWAVECKQTHQFVGMVGLQQRLAEDGILDTHFVEVVWRLQQAFWGQGLAPEAASAAITYAFAQLPFDTIYSLTALSNLPSQRVMQKIGMHNTEKDFQHPKLGADSPLSWHCLYKLTKSQWLSSRRS
ncbi:GNAT family N-acetyltransferase [Vibrio superstes]|uniref:N-acetyltransferase n=1 Tax=Vibrio superstes NBRC 103154 TaxID=1219062 RepID=A0A511QM98_9VIBR|nr:GNAT family N-acetyltransferase [Vibrio superstes]GEM78439.1 N-acetyltransferase [Vibrio superstes NBRC 103154]